jgi:hypothetical protein
LGRYGAPLLDVLLGAAMTARRRTKAAPGTSITFRLTRAERDRIERVIKSCGFTDSISAFVKHAIAAQLSGEAEPLPQQLCQDVHREAALFSKILAGWMRSEPDNWHQQNICDHFQRLIIAIDALPTGQ